MTKKIKLPKKYIGPFISGKYDRNSARLYLKREDSQYQLVDEVYPAMFVKPKDIDNLPNNEFFIGYKDEEKYTRVILDPTIKRTDVDEILTDCFDRKVFPMEADVDPIRRWFSDTGAKVSTNHKALFFDLEALPEIKGFEDEAKKTHRILSFSAMDLHGNSWFAYNETIDNTGEEKVIREFLKIAQNYDTLLAWNGKDYDFFVLRWRCYYLDIKVDWRNWNLLDYMLTVKKCLMSIPEKNFKRSFALDNIGKNVLGIEKLKVSVPMDRLDILISENRVKELQAYNDRDVEIMIELEKSREFLELHSTVCGMCRKFPDNNSLYPNTLADGLMLRLAVEENRHFRSRFSSIEDLNEDKYAGAYVMDAKVGFHQNVQVIDFSSLYPSIIISWNMSPETKIREDWNYPNKVLSNIAIAKATNTEFRTDFEGMLPLALRKLLEQRKVYKKKEKEAEVGSKKWKRYGHESTALKVVANSMYGLLGSKYTRYHDRDIAESVTLTGQMLTKKSIEYCESRGHEVVHADTDSAFVKADEETTKRLIVEINDNVIPYICKESNCPINKITMDFDKGYKTLLLQTKKKYGGQLSLHKGRRAPENMEPDVKGLEFQRSDILPYAQNMQMYFLKRLLDPNVKREEIEIELRKWTDEFFKKEIDVSEITISQAVKKRPEDYPVVTPAVQAAKQLLNMGYEFFPGMKVQYIITSHNKDETIVVPVEKFNGTFDRTYYWKNKIITPTTRLIRARFQDETFEMLDDIENHPQQGNLFVDINLEREKSRMLPKRKKKKKPAKEKKPVKITIDVTGLSDNQTRNFITTIKKFLDSSKDITVDQKMKTRNYQVCLYIVTEKFAVDIHTVENSTRKNVEELKKLFPKRISYEIK